MTILLDPSDERVPVARTITPRPSELSGQVALLDISKPRGNVLLDRLQERITTEFPNVSVKRYAKPTFTKPAPEDLRREIREQNGFVIEALAD